jgi:hypothetical protein
MRDRLIELIGEARAMEASGIKCKVSNEYIADYILANGWILPPCKVGDMVHAKGWWWRDRDDILDYQITNITITQNKKGEWTRKYRAMRFFDGKTWDRQLNFSFDDIGKTVFITREEAEKALKENN